MRGADQTPPAAAHRDRRAAGVTDPRATTHSAQTSSSSSLRSNRSSSRVMATAGRRRLRALRASTCRRADAKTARIRGFMCVCVCAWGCENVAIFSVRATENRERCCASFTSVLILLNTHRTLDRPSELGLGHSRRHRVTPRLCLSDVRLPVCMSVAEFSQMRMLAN